MSQSTTRISAALAESLRHNAAILSRALPRARRGEVRAIHRVRVATRRLRESLLLDHDHEQQRLTKELRRVTKALGPVRELDVARDVLARHARRQDWPAAVVTRVDEYCERLRTRCLEESGDALGDLDVRTLRKDLAAAADALESASAPEARTAAAARLRERARILAHEIEAVGTLYSAAPLHRLRIAAKKLRYMVELAGESEPGALRHIKRLQTELGRLHDTQMLQERIRELAATTNDRGLVASLTGIVQALEARCREWHAQILKTLPATSRLARGIGRALPASIGPRALGKPVRMRQPLRKERIA